MSRLFFKKLDIRKAPGFRRGINVSDLSSLSSGINILTGPNGAGKSTTARIIQQLLWHDDSRGLDARGVFELDGHQWISEIDSLFFRFQKDGVEAVPEGLPAASARRVYNLALHDLVKAEDGDLAKNILDESIGGYDLDKAQTDLYSSKSRVTTRAVEYTALRESIKKLKEVTELHRQLKNDEYTLSQLEDEKKEAETAAEMKELYRLASDYIGAKQNFENVGSKMSGYPESLNMVSGEELMNIENLEEEAEKEARNISDARDKIKEEESKIEALKLPEKGIEDSILSELKGRTELLAEYEREIRQVKEPAIACQESVESEAKKNICNIVDPEGWKGIDLKQIGDLDMFFNYALSILENKMLIDAEISDLEKLNPETSSSESGNLTQGITILGDWLKEQNEKESSGIKFWPVLVVSILSSALLLLWLLTRSATLLSPYVIIPVIVSIITITVAGMIGSKKGSTQVALKIRESDFIRTGLKQPEIWEPSKVTERLSELMKGLNESIQKVAEVNASQTKLKTLRVKSQKLEPEIRKINQQKDKLLEDLKALPDFPENISKTMSGLYIFLSNLKLWQSAVNKLESMRSEIESLEKSRDEELDNCNLIFEELQGNKAGDSIKAKAIFEQFSDHERQRRELVKNIGALNKSVDECNERKSKAEKKTSGIYLKLNLEDGRKDEVAVLLSSFDDYKKDKQELSNAKAFLDEKSENLGKHILYAKNKAEISAIDLEECRLRVQKYETKAARLSTLLCDITRIDTQVQQKKSGRELEEALAEKHNALINLEKLHHQHLSSLTGSLLIENIKKETGEISRPEVLKKADDLFRKITNGKFELRVSGDKFRAFDTQQMEGLDLTQISTGTRVQLLLAIRLAFIEHQERGVKLPILADELLANSDDQRAEAIISALYEISKLGRQVFYLTAQTDEASKWENFLKKMGDDEYRIILMDEAYKGYEGLMHKPDFNKMELAREISHPDAMSMKEYRKALRIPSYDLLSDNSGKLSIGYLTEDTGLLFRCIGYGLESWGQITSFDYSGLIEGLDDKTIEGMRNKVSLLVEFQKLYRPGRPKRVDMDVLLESNAITDKFKDEIKAKLDQSGGNPVLLLNDPPSGFRKKNLEILEAYLIEMGFIDEEKPMSIEEIKSRLLAISASLSLDAKTTDGFINGILGS